MALTDQITACWAPQFSGGFRIIDVSPLRNHMVWSNMASTALRNLQFRGRAIRCINFDGVDDFASVGVNANYELSSVKPLSFSVWFRTASTADWCPFARSLAGAGASRYGVFRSGGTSYLLKGQNTGGLSMPLPTSNTNGLWHMVSGTYYPDGLVKGYYDGVYLDQSQQTAEAAGSYSTIIGKYNDSSGGTTGNIFQFPGDVAEVVIWKRIVTDPEWMAVYSAGPNGIGAMLTGQAFPRRRVSQAIAAGGATPWLYARRRSQIIGAGGVH